MSKGMPQRSIASLRHPSFALFEPGSSDYQNAGDKRNPPIPLQQTLAHPQQGRGVLVLSPGSHAAHPGFLLRFSEQVFLYIRFFDPPAQNAKQHLPLAFMKCCFELYLVFLHSIFRGSPYKYSCCHAVIRMGATLYSSTDLLESETPDSPLIGENPVFVLFLVSLMRIRTYKAPGAHPILLSTSNTNPAGQGSARTVSMTSALIRDFLCLSVFKRSSISDFTHPRKTPNSTFRWHAEGVVLNYFLFSSIFRQSPYQYNSSLSNH